MRKNKIILIHAEFNNGSLLPLGILHIGAYLLKFGYEVDFIDTRFDDFKNYDY